MSTETNAPTSGQPTQGAPIVLDDEGAQSAPEQQAPAASQPTKPDPDELVLDLARRGRELSRKEKEFERTRGEFEAFRNEAMESRQMRALAKSDPMAFLAKVADAAGLELDAVVDAYTTRKSGETPSLSAEDRVARLERQLQEKEQREAKERDERAAREKEQAGDRALQAHLSEIKGFAASAADNFPLFNDPEDLEANAIAAFDLRMLAHEKGETLSNAAAVQEIEKRLRKDTEKRAQRLGIARPASATPTPTPSPTVPRAVNAAAAPFEASPQIRSDEEIAADWAAFARRTA
jgi:hypothetical protein